MTERRCKNMRDDRLSYDVSDEERQVIDENTLQDARDMMGLDELEDE